jgi:hypothetical protein
MSETDKKDVVKILSEIETVGDLEKNKKIIVDLMVDQLRAGLDALKTVIDGSLSPEDIQTRMTNIEGEREKLEQKMEKELERIGKIPGAEDVVMSLRGEMTGQLGSLAQEMGQIMAQLMGKLMGGLFGGEMGDEMAEGMSQTITGFNFEDAELEGYELPKGEIISALDFIRELKSTDELKAKEDETVKLLVELFKNELKTVQEIKEINLPLEELRARVLELQKRQRNILSNIEKEFTRLDANPGSEYGDEFDERTSGIVEPIMNEYFDIIEDLEKRYMDLQRETGTDAEDTKPREEVYCPECKYLMDYDTPEHCSFCGLYLEDYYEGRVKLDSLYSLYEARTLETFNENKEDIIEAVQEDLKYDIYDLEIFDSPEIISEEQEKIQKIEAKFKSLDKELEVHLQRLKALPEAEEVVNAFEKEFRSKLGPKLKEIEGHLKRIKNTNI